jgi:acetolactate synthase-1/2/3 large subunit
MLQRSSAMQMTGGEALARQLAREGVRDIFGVPGVQLDYAMDGLASAAPEITFRNTRHEQAASYMADGYARAAGTEGVCMVVPGPGLLNTLAGLSTAYACSSPVLCLAAHLPAPAIGQGYGLLHEIPDQSRILASLTKWSAVAPDPAAVTGLVREAFAQMRSGRPQPVGLEVPTDVLQAVGEVELVEPASPAPLPPDPDAMRQAAELLRNAERPAIYAGWGVQAAEATEELRALAELLEAPVVMSLNGRGTLSSRHPLALTSLGGRRVLPQADVVLAVGSRFVDGQGRQIALAPGAKLVLLNAQADHLGGPRAPTVALHGDARLGLQGLLEHVGGVAPRPSRRAELDAVRAWCDEQCAAVEPQLSWVRALRAAIPDDGILVNDLTQVGYLARVAYPVYGPRTYLTPGYQGTLGYGFPTALGAKLGRPDHPVVSIAGDGGFGFNLQELSTARKYGIGVVTVVFADGAYGNVQRTQVDAFESRLIGTELVNPDFVKLADAFGIAGARATSPAQLEGLLRETLAGGEPVLIEVPVGEMPSPWHLIR